MLRFSPCVAIKNHLFVGFWLAVENSQPINSRVLRCNTMSEMEHTIWKGIKSWLEKRWQIVCAILFDLFCSVWQVVRHQCTCIKAMSGDGARWLDEMSSTNGGCSGEEDFLGVLLGLRPNTGAARRGRVRESGWSKVTDLKFEHLYDSWFLKEVQNQPTTRSKD